MPIPIALPEPSLRYEQDSEWCVVKVNGSWRQMRFHDYSEIYRVQGLYERLFYDVLKCESPVTVRRLLAEQLAETDVDPAELRVLDVGAGNGMVAAEMADLGATHLVGVDIIPEARDAALRDRPGLYDDYRVLDLTDPPLEERKRLARQRLNCLTCVAALGFGDIPPRAFLEAYNLVETGGWIAFTLKEEFLDGADPSGFAALVSRSLREGVMEARTQERYRHRISTAGEPLHYVAIIGIKVGDMPLSLLH